MVKTGMVAIAIALAALLAGCATPSEVKRPLARPTMARSVPLPDLKPYQATIPHAAPQSDQPATP